MRDITPTRIRRTAEALDIEPEYNHGSQAEELHLSFYWNILVRRRRSIIIVFLLIFAVGAYFPFAATPLYTASSIIKIEMKNPQVTGVGAVDPSGGAGGNYDYYQTQFALLKSRPLAARVISDLDLKSNPIFTDAQIISPNPLSHLQSWTFRLLRYFSNYMRPLFQPERDTGAQPDTSMRLENSAGQGPIQLGVSPHLIDRYLKFANIAPVLKTTLVKVQFTTPDPRLSQALSNAHAQRFLQTSLESRFDLTKEAREFLDKKKSELQTKMEKSEAALNGFRRTHGVVSLEKGENIVVDRLVDLNRQLTAARAQRIEVESLYRTVEKRDYQDLSEIMRQGLIQQLKSNLANLEGEKVRLSGIFRADHPRMQELTQQIAAGRDALNNEIAAIVRGTQSNYAAAAAKERALEAEAMQQQQLALKLKEVGVTYTILQEEVNANRTLYENVLKRLSETNVSNDTAMSNMQIAEVAERPRSPSSPNVPVYLLANIFLGVFAGIGLAICREYFDSSVSTPDGVWRSVGLSTLGVIPNSKSLKTPRHQRSQIEHILPNTRSRLSNESTEGGRELVISHSSRSIVSEAYRTIRTSLLLSQAEKPPQVILMTSPSPGEGKSVTTLNLAIALADDGNSVVVVDGDMRKGCCHNRLGLRNEAGLSNVLTGNATLQEGIQITSITGLSLLSRGALPPNPSELLGSRKMRELLDELRQTYTFILIDSPPILGISDAAILSIICDGVLLVFNGQSTSKASAQEAVSRLDMIRAHLLGVILNGIDLKDPSYSYFRNYDAYYSYRLTNEGEHARSSGDGFHQSSHDQNNGTGKRRHLKDRYVAAANTQTAANIDRLRAAQGNGAASPKRADAIKGVQVIEPVYPCAPDGMMTFTSSGKVAGGSPLATDIVHDIADALGKAIGPIAAQIVHEQIAALGESFYGFPKSRSGELLDRIRGELTQDECLLFAASLPEGIRKLGGR